MKSVGTERRSRVNDVGRVVAELMTGERVAELVTGKKEVAELVAGREVAKLETWERWLLI